MDSIGPECNELKKKYDDCFNEWFGEYLKGNTTDSCGSLLTEYKHCVHKVLASKGIDVDEAYRKVLGTDQEKKAPEQKPNVPKN